MGWLMFPAHFQHILLIGSYYNHLWISPHHQNPPADLTVPLLHPCMTFQLCPWWLAASPACWDELEDSPFKCREQYPRGKKEFLPRSGQGRGCCVAPPVAVEAETNTENAFSDVSPRRKMLGGLIYFCGSAERDWIAVTNLGQLEWSLWPKDLSPSYKFNFCLWWLTVQNNTQQKEDKKRGRKLKCPCLHALLKCHDPRLAPLIPPVSLSDDEMMMGGGAGKEAIIIIILITFCRCMM